MSNEDLKRVYAQLLGADKVKSKADFARQLGYSGRTYITDLFNGGGDVPFVVEYKIREVFGDFSILQSAKSDEADGSRSSKALRPFYDAPASAGDVDTDLMPVTRPVGYIDTGDLFGDCDAAIRTRGNSMLSGYPSGTVLGINLDANRFIEPGELYVLETRSKRLFKRLFPSTKGDDYVQCYSDNTARFETGPKEGEFFYPTFDVHKEDIVRKFNVVGSAREHANSLVLYRKPIKEANTERDMQTIEV